MESKGRTTYNEVRLFIRISEWNRSTTSFAVITPFHLIFSVILLKLMLRKRVTSLQLMLTNVQVADELVAEFSDPAMGLAPDQVCNDLFVCLSIFYRTL